jgi:hypothetical protein
MNGSILPLVRKVQLCALRLWFLFDRLAVSDSRRSLRLDISLSGRLLSIMAAADQFLQRGAGLCFRPAFAPQVAYAARTDRDCPPFAGFYGECSEIAIGASWACRGASGSRQRGVRTFR